MHQLIHLLQPLRLTEIVDIGANPIDGDPPYKTLLQSKLCRVTGFEPQVEALATLNQQKSELEQYLPYAIGDGNTHTLKICQYSGMTSLLEPNQNTLDNFVALKTNATVLERISIPTSQLDDIQEIQQLDFLKIDIQGTELSVFRSGREKLNNAVAIQTEISFVTIYENQPSFGEIDIELRNQGFIPHCFAAIKKWPIAPFTYENEPLQAVNQLLEADIVYVRDFTQPQNISDEQLKHLALIAHCCYQSFDLTLRCIDLLEQRAALPAHSQQVYVNMLNSSRHIT
ncbi:FkbM family methyltransferase [Acinetobacter piscicola]|uniref:FkbM family methyltransferase n=1 Tax=Acinetobacter piscicola TaxID=2006115 RepID=UPI000B7D3BFA|nr:FkbM family methyltransferase [Acinetobacter piscicola]